MAGVPVVVDGGFMRGADVIKGLCLGASAVGMGRFEALAAPLAVCQQCFARCRFWNGKFRYL